MGWLIAIVCVILVVVFWRIFAPIIAIAVAGIALLAIFFWIQDQREERRRAEAQRRLHERLSVAGSALDTSRQWEVRREADPSTGELVPRTASIVSDDGLCQLNVESRIDGTRLTGIYCDGLKISAYEGVRVKFDSRPTAKGMQLQHFTDYENVYIPSGQYSGNLGYDSFLAGLTEGRRMALRLKFIDAGEHWIRFSLKGSSRALAEVNRSAVGR